MSDQDVLCFSHLRWDFVFQRPNHLMSRFARRGRVLFIEEPLQGQERARLEHIPVAPNLSRVIPHLPSGTSTEHATALIRTLLALLCRELRMQDAIHWFYTPLMLPLAEGLPGSLTVYDCMDELANFMHAPPELIQRERELIERADIVFTGGMALYEAKRSKHHNVHGVPSSVDVPFFKQARRPQPDPEPQACIAHPRVGYCGVIDERIDLGLLAHLAAERPDTQLVMLGPLAKIDPASLPRRSNIHYLGSKPYQELPSYMAGWDAAMMPFALNEATRFISPTKTPEYLAAGKRVVSTAITDIVVPYARMGLVRIARSPDEFVSQLDEALADDGASDERRDAFLASNSWDSTCSRMQALVASARAKGLEDAISSALALPPADSAR